MGVFLVDRFRLFAAERSKAHRAPHGNGRLVDNLFLCDIFFVSFVLVLSLMLVLELPLLPSSSDVWASAARSMWCMIWYVHGILNKCMYTSIRTYSPNTINQFINGNDMIDGGSRYTRQRRIIFGSYCMNVGWSIPWQDLELPLFPMCAMWVDAFNGFECGCSIQFAQKFRSPN